jgi:hypothetical protein
VGWIYDFGELVRYTSVGTSVCMCACVGVFACARVHACVLIKLAVLLDFEKEKYVSVRLSIRPSVFHPPSIAVPVHDYEGDATPRISRLTEVLVITLRNLLSKRCSTSLARTAGCL